MATREQQPAGWSARSAHPSPAKAGTKGASTVTRAKRTLLSAIIWCYRIVGCGISVASILLSVKNDVYKHFSQEMVDEGDGFVGYKETTVDPSPWALVVTVSLSLFMIALIPLCLAVRENYRRARRLRRHQTFDFGSVDESAMTSDRQKQLDYQLDRIVGEETGEEDGCSVYGLGNDEVLPPDSPTNVWWKPKSRDYRRLQSAARVLSPSQTPKRQSSANASVSVTIDEGEESIEIGDDIFDDGSSFTSSLSQEDALQEENTSPTPSDKGCEGGYVELKDPNRQNEIFNAESPLDTDLDAASCFRPDHCNASTWPAEVSEKVRVDVWCGDRPWWRFFCSRRFVHKVTKCASWDAEMKGLVKLAFPFTLHSMAAHVFGLMELAVIGRLMGTDELSAFYTVEFVLSLSTMFMEGALASLHTLCSHAVGAEKYRLAGQYVQLAVIFYQVLLIPVAAIWWYHVEDLVVWIGFDRYVASMAGAYAEIAFVHCFFAPYGKALRYLLDVTDHEMYAAGMGMLCSAANFVLVLVSALHSRGTLQDVAWIHLGIDLTFVALNLLTANCMGWFKGGYWGGVAGSIAVCDFQVVKLFFEQAIPLSFASIMATGQWEVLFVFAGFMGPAEVSVWGLVGSLWEAMEEVGLATADAAEVRVANLLGSNQPKRARYCAHKSLFFGVVVASLCTLPIAVCRDEIPAWFTNDWTMQQLLGKLIPFICAGNVAMMFASTSWTLLGAQGRFGLATAMGFVGSWGVTLPLSAIASLALNLDLQGLAGSVVVGYACSGALDTYFLMRSNWDKLARKIQKRTLRNAALAKNVDASDTAQTTASQHSNNKFPTTFVQGQY